jgi:hypothetical protein
VRKTACIISFSPDAVQPQLASTKKKDPRVASTSERGFIYERQALLLLLLLDERDWYFSILF